MNGLDTPGVKLLIHQSKWEQSVINGNQKLSRQTEASINSSGILFHGNAIELF